MSVKVCSPFVTPSQTSPKLGLNNNKKRPFSLLRTPTKTSAETKFIFPAVSPRPVSSHRAAEQKLVMIGTASAGSTSLGSAVSRVAAAVADTNNSNNQLTAQQRWDSLTTLSQKYSLENRGGFRGTGDFCASYKTVKVPEAQIKQTIKQNFFCKSFETMIRFSLLLGFLIFNFEITPHCSFCFLLLKMNKTNETFLSFQLLTNYNSCPLQNQILDLGLTAKTP